METLNYHHLRYFWAVAHDGNLTRTAEQLNLSQSALSVQIRQLEARLGHDLFERRGRALHLTEAGRIVLDHADAIFAAGGELLDRLKKSGGAQQILRVGALATLSRNFQLGFIRPLLGRADVEIQLQSGRPADLLEGLEAHNLDVVLMNRAPAGDATRRYIAHRLAQQAVSLVGTLKRAGDCRDPAKLLQDHPLILPSADSSVRLGFDALIARLSLQPRIAAEVDDMAMMRLLAREDIGLAVLPPIVVRDELRSGDLADLLPLPGVYETFYAVTIERRFPNPLLRPLLDRKLD
jgi:LysR family transcriptional activator of nhaA